MPLVGVVLSTLKEAVIRLLLQKAIFKPPSILMTPFLGVVLRKVMWYIFQGLWMELCIKILFSFVSIMVMGLQLPCSPHFMICTRWPMKGIHVFCCLWVSQRLLILSYHLISLWVNWSK